MTMHFCIVILFIYQRVGGERLKRILVAVLLLVAILLLPIESGDLICVFRNNGGEIESLAITPDELKTYSKMGYDVELPYTAKTETVLFSNDGHAYSFPKEMVQAELMANGFVQPMELMHDSQGTSYLSLMGEDESLNLFPQATALISNGKETKSVLKREADALRDEGWNIIRYSSRLYDLEEQLQTYIKGKSGQYGIYVKNLKNGEELIINDGPYYAASLIKLFVMTGTYSQIHSGNLAKTELIEKTLTNMITISDNLASNYLVKMMGAGNYKEGFARENEMTKSMGCYNTIHQALFADAGDYVFYGRNSVSPLDCGIVLEKIYRGELLSPEISAEMLSLLKNQQRRNKIPYLLPKGTVCANKTGETTTIESDVGIVFSPNADYIICVVTNFAYNGAADVQNISRIVYDYFN